MKNGGGGGSRTRDLLFRREPLYPTELRHRFPHFRQRQHPFPRLRYVDMDADFLSCPGNGPDSPRPVAVVYNDTTIGPESLQH